MLASIIIPVYQRITWIRECLEALTTQTLPQGVSFTVWVIDDGSSNAPDLKSIAESFSSSLRISYRYQKKCGPAAAKNTGIELSQGEIICFLDDDSIPHPQWLHAIVESFRDDASLGIVNGKILSHSQKPGSLSFLLQQSVYTPKKKWATSNIAYRRSVLEEIGIFDERYTLASWEDNDLGFRAWRKKIKHRYNPYAIVYHCHERTFPEFWEKSVRNGYGLGQFGRKYIFRFPHVVIAAIILVVKDIWFVCAPAVWRKKRYTKAFLRFIWAFNSLRGFLQVFFGCKRL